MIKAILFDVDGLVIKQHRYFSEIYSEKHNVPLASMEPFFKNKFGLCQKGKADLKIEIEPYLKEWKWENSVDEFLNLWFTSESSIDNEVINIVREFKNKGIKCYLATNQEKYRAEYITNLLERENCFEGMFYSCDLGCKKPEQEFFSRIAGSLKINSAEILLWDDKKENVEGAKDFGFNAELYTTLENFKEKMLNYFN